MRTAILISGRGSNMEALALSAQDSDNPAEIVLVIADRPKTCGLEIAQDLGIDTAFVDYRSFNRKLDAEDQIHNLLSDANVDLICLAGFMRILSPDFLNKWPDKVLNIHPSLLPAFRGLDTHARAIQSGVRIHGATVHFVRPELDEGPILAQAAVPVIPDDDEESLAARILECEHVIYPQALRQVAEGRITLVGDQVKSADPIGIVPGCLIWPAPPHH